MGTLAIGKSFCGPTRPDRATGPGGSPLRVGPIGNPPVPLEERAMEVSPGSKRRRSEGNGATELFVTAWNAE